jgi:hypothetical protein
LQRYGCIGRKTTFSSGHDDRSRPDRLAEAVTKVYRRRRVSEYEFADDDPEYANDLELEDDPEIADLPLTDPEDMPPDQGDIGRLEYPEEGD